MSLQLAAQHLAARGRGDDKVLVHMTHGEVKSLNDLAKHHGGQLTTNPQTGLPEAGFLSSMLPMLIGAGLAAATGGSSLMIGAGVGGLQALRTGSLGKGLMAGLGAYGGADLGAALATQGAQSAAAQSLTSEAAQNALPATLPANYQQMAMSTLTPEQIAAQRGTDFAGRLGNMTQGASTLSDPGGLNSLMQNLGGGTKAMQAGMAAAAPVLGSQKDPLKPTAQDANMGQRYSFTGGAITPTPAPDVPSYDDMMTKQGNFGRQQKYFNNPTYTPISDTAAKDLYHFADGGMPVEQMSNNAAIGANTMYPMANMATSAFATPYQTPQSTNMMSAIAPSSGGTVDQMSGEPNMQGTRLATGGLSDAHYNLGDYSDGGRLLRGPGDGVSDSIPAVIGKKQPARLADNEFVIPARIVSEIGNGSSEAGARKLYAMMDRIPHARKKSIGKHKVAVDSKSYKALDRL